MHDWLKAFHLISMVAWFAALFYLPRLFVYHSLAQDEISVERFKTMEHKLYKQIANPSMYSTLIFGAMMIYLAPKFYMAQYWLHAKIGIIILLMGYHFTCYYYLKRFAQDANTKSDRYFRVFNEIPVLFLAAIVILAVLKPF